MLDRDLLLVSYCNMHYYQNGPIQGILVHIQKSLVLFTTWQNDSLLGDLDNSVYVLNTNPVLIKC